jgi:uncharacterized protein (DUF2336 family)
MVSSLSQADVARLLAEPSPQARAEVAGKLAAEIDSPQLTEAELRLAQDILRVMAKDIEVTVRAALARGLRGASRLPHDVAVRLADDIEAVALPILLESPVLTDQDLIDAVRRGSAAKQAAVAGRTNVSENLADVLVTEAGETAVATLMGNAAARVSEATLVKAVDRFRASEIVKETLVRRAALPITVAERLVHLVSERLQDYLVSHHELPPALAADLVLRSRERSVISLSDGSSEQELETLVAQMQAHGRLSASLVLRALCMGDLAFFETALASLAGVPAMNARMLIHDAGQLGLRSLYQKSGLPARFLPAVRVAIQVVRETPMDGEPHDRERYRARVIERILTQYEDFGAEDLDYLLEKLGDVRAFAS